MNPERIVHRWAVCYAVNANGVDASGSHSLLCGTTFNVSLKLSAHDMSFTSQKLSIYFKSQHTKMGDNRFTDSFIFDQIISCKLMER